MALAIFKLGSAAILAEDQPDEIVAFLRTLPGIDYDELLKVAFRFLDTLSSDEIQHLRQTNLVQVIKTIEENTKLNQLYDLQGKTKFGKDQLDSIYSRFTAVVSATGTSTLDFKSFQLLFLEFVPSWQYRRDLIEAVFKKADIDNTQALDFREFTMVLSQLCTGSLEQKFEYCFCLHDVDSDSILDKGDVYRVLDALIRLIRKEDTAISNLNVFVTVIFEKCDPNNSGKISLDKLKLEILDKPLLEGFISQ